VKVAYDDRGNITEWVYLDADGSPVVTNDGYHRKTALYDPFSNEIEEEYFGNSGEPVGFGADPLNGYAGYHKKRYPTIYAAIRPKSLTSISRIIPLRATKNSRAWSRNMTAGTMSSNASTTVRINS
jgi:hypothetical protein